MASNTTTSIGASIITGTSTGTSTAGINSLNDFSTLDVISSPDALETDESLVTPSVQPLPANPPARNQIVGTEGADVIFGTPGDDEILALEGDDTIFGTLGSDIINGGDGFDTVDYTQLKQAITLLSQGGLGAGSNTNSLIRIESIIAPVGLANAIDASPGTGSDVSIFASLADQRLEVRNIPGLGTQVFNIQNFAKVKGTRNADVLIGDDNRNTLYGGNGNDLLEGRGGNDKVGGGSGEDRLIGAAQVSTQVKEVDRLTGGTGGDRFVLAASSKALYTAFGASDYAQIIDFSAGDVIELGSQDRYRIQRTDIGFDILVTNTPTQSELIAKVRISPSASSPTSKPAFGVDLLSNVPTEAFQIGAGQAIGGFVGV